MTGTNTKGRRSPKHIKQTTARATSALLTTKRAATALMAEIASAQIERSRLRHWSPHGQQNFADLYPADADSIAGETTKRIFCRDGFDEKRSRTQ
jgi:hypothetical protein